MTTMALRFRDLVTPPNGTIEQHNDIITKNGEVYWGWWAKAGEQCPSRFLELENELSSSSAQVLLFDSGQNKLYIANLIDIAFRNSNEGMACPDLNLTPEYYRERSFKAWFKFDSISEVNSEHIESTLHAHSYHDDNFGLFKNNEPFKDFFNKQVSSVEELRHQDRTIWFLKLFVDGEHDTKEILLYNSSNVDPSIFPKNYSKLYSSKIHWVTDLHFSDESNRHACDDEQQGSPIKVLIEEKFKERLNALIVSGDMTWSATTSEFDKTREFYKYLCSNTNLAFDKIGFCPGNHDLAYDGALTSEQKEALEKYHLINREPSEKTRLTPDEIQSLKAMEASTTNKENYKQHFEGVLSVKPNEYLSMGRKYLIDGQRPVDICFLNSNSLEQYKNLFQGNGFIGEKQRSDASKKMGWEIPKAYGAVRIVVLHHNLLPVEYSRVPYLGASPGSVVYDAQATLKWCYEKGVDVILHGHTHQRSLVKLEDRTSGEKRKVWLVGLGSTSVHQSHLVYGHLNQLAELDFSDQFIAMQFFNIQENSIVEDGDPVLLD
ncbi:metallophosphoesterase family protein [Alteromonas marina]